jgi:NAD(P)-dependent dehydrogenase (short-subunit alcohol dehydrogenase family)
VTVPGRFAGKVAAVTGAGSGIGEATATAFAAGGARVVALDYDEAAAHRTAAAIISAGGTAVPYVADIATEDGAAGLADLALREFGALSILHNNVFGMQAGPLEDITLSGWNETLRLTLTSAFLGTKYAAPVMAAGGGGVIVNTASIAGLQPDPGLAAYAAAKAGVMSLTRSTAIEYGPEGIRACAVCPSTVETPSFLQMFGEGRTASWLTSAPPGRKSRPPRTDEELKVLRAGKAAAHLTGAILKPAQVAALVTWLACDDASGITGVSYPVDAGLTIQAAGPAAV